jgi:hypothetical protein
MRGFDLIWNYIVSFGTYYLLSLSHHIHLVLVPASMGIINAS